MMEEAKSLSLRDSRLRIKMCGHSLIDAEEGGPGYLCYHRHDFWQVNLCSHGGIDIRLKRYGWSLRKGDIVIFPPGIRHGFNYVEGERFGCFSFKFDVPDLAPPADQSAILLTEESDRSQRLMLIETVSRFFYDFFPARLTERPVQFLPPAGAPTMILEDLLFGILRYGLQKHNLFWKKDLQNQVRNYVREANGTPVSVSEVARHLGYSEGHLLKLLKQQTGKTTKRLLDEERINLAGKFLHYSSMNISEIAEHMGFSDVVHFCRVFKKLTGKTPREYRRMTDPENP